MFRNPFIRVADLVRVRAGGVVVSQDPATVLTRIQIPASASLAWSVLVVSLISSVSDFEPSRLVDGGVPARISRVKASMVFGFARSRWEAFELGWLEAGGLGMLNAD